MDAKRTSRPSFVAFLNDDYYYRRGDPNHPYLRFRVRELAYPHMTSNQQRFLDCLRRVVCCSPLDRLYHEGLWRIKQFPFVSALSDGGSPTGLPVFDLIVPIHWYCRSHSRRLPRLVKGKWIPCGPDEEVFEEECYVVRSLQALVEEQVLRDMLRDDRQMFADPVHCVAKVNLHRQNRVVAKNARCYFVFESVAHTMSRFIDGCAHVSRDMLAMLSQISMLADPSRKQLLVIISEDISTINVDTTCLPLDYPTVIASSECSASKDNKRNGWWIIHGFCIGMTAYWPSGRLTRRPHAPEYDEYTTAVGAFARSRLH